VRHASGLEELDRVAVGIFKLDLFSGRADLHLVAKVEPGLFQRLNLRRKISNVENHAIPSAGFLLVPIGHWAGTRRAWPAEQKLEVSERDCGELGEMLMFELETEACRVKSSGATHILYFTSGTSCTTAATRRRSSAAGSSISSALRAAGVGSWDEFIRDGSWRPWPIEVPARSRDRRRG